MHTLKIDTPHQETYDTLRFAHECWLSLRLRLRIWLALALLRRIWWRQIPWLWISKYTVFRFSKPKNLRSANANNRPRIREMYTMPAYHGSRPCRNLASRLHFTLTILEYLRLPRLHCPIGPLSTGALNNGRAPVQCRAHIVPHKTRLLYASSWCRFASGLQSSVRSRPMRCS